MNNTCQHPVWNNQRSFELISREKIWIMVCRALNLMDKRLVDHGIRVALVLMDMLKAEGKLDEMAQKRLGVVTLFHDIGAYRIDEIDKLLQFETKNVWQHAIYSYLFLKPFFSDYDLTKAVLYHHARYDERWSDQEEVLHYGQLMHVADRVCIWHDELKGSSEVLEQHLASGSGTVFSPEGVALFWKANMQYGTWAKLQSSFTLEQLAQADFVSADEVDMYLHILVEAVDFRSRATVLHTKGVMEIALEMARLLEMSELMQQKVYYGALLHDLGKIGTPLSILEKPGRLTPEEMVVMRQHVLLTGQIISGCVEEETALIGLRHHEKLDGSGYPHGLTAEDLTVPQRLIAVADILSALCMNRSYKTAFSREQAMSILWEMVHKKHLDAELVGLADREFDRIITAAAQRCEVVEDMYVEVQEQFQNLMLHYSPQEACTTST